MCTVPHRSICLLIGIVVHVSFPPLLIACRITQRQLWPTRACIRVNLLHPQGAPHFSQHFLRTLSQLHYWLERWSANVPAGTLRSTAKTHRRCTGSRYRFTGAFSATIATHSFSSDISSVIMFTLLDHT